MKRQQYKIIPEQNLHKFLVNKTWQIFEQHFANKFKRPWLKESNYTVLSSMSIYEKVSKKASIISIGFGTKSLPLNIIQNNEQELMTDMHGQILAIAGFNKYILNNIKNYENQNESILKYNQKKKKFFLNKEKYSLILYTSEPFCGDCSICESQQYFSGAKPLSSFNFDEYDDKKYVENILRTKPGRLDLPKQKRSLILSCSDKIAQMNILGLQGKFLFSLVMPIYMDQIIIECNSKYKQPIERGLNFVERISSLKNIKKQLVSRKIFNIVIDQRERFISKQFKLNIPEIIIIENENKQPDRKTGFQMCGIIAQQQSQWLNGKTGLPEGSSLKNYKTKGKISHFCEQKLKEEYQFYKQNALTFKYEAISERLRLLFGEWIDFPYK